MENLFSIGELARSQNISKQTLIFYDKIGLFKPAYVNKKNGYRYYSAEQMDYLDTILIMKKIGIPLEEIRTQMKNYTTASSLVFLKQELKVITEKIRELTLIENRLRNRCEQVEKAFLYADPVPKMSQTQPVYILCRDVQKPFDRAEISLATKSCYTQAFKEKIPIFFQCGVAVPLQKILDGKYTEARMAFLTTEKWEGVDNIRELPAGLVVSTYHFGHYYDTIDQAYKRLLAYCGENHLEILSDAYEFCINDYITSRNEDEFITKVMVYVREKEA